MATSIMIAKFKIILAVLFFKIGSGRADYSIDCTENLCPYENVTYTCMFTTSPFVKWTVDFGYKTSSLSLDTSSTENGDIITYIEPFIFQFFPDGLYMGITTANFTVVPEINATTVTCIDATPFDTTIGTGCSISIKSFGPPASPQNVSITVLSDSSVQLSWSPSSSHRTKCLSQYTITVFSEEEGTVTHKASGSVKSTDLVGLSVEVEYSVSLTAIDNIGRVGNNSQPVYFTLKYPTKLDLNVSVTVPSCLDDPIDIFVTWSGKEKYTVYNLYHNVSGNVKKTTYNTTQEKLQGSQGKTYSFFVEAVNSVGVGPPSNLSIVVLPYLSLQGAVAFQGIPVVPISVPTSTSIQSEFPTDSQLPSEETTTQFSWYIILPATALVAAAIGALLTTILACIIIKMHHRSAVKRSETNKYVKTPSKKNTEHKKDLSTYDETELEAVAAN